MLPARNALPLILQVQAAFAAAAILIFGGWVDARKAIGFVDWALLLLIGSALGLSKGIVNSGLADYVGGAIRDSGISAEGSIFVLYFFTVVSDDPFVCIIFVLISPPSTLPSSACTYG